MFRIFQKKELRSSFIAIFVIVLILAGYWFFAKENSINGAKIVVDTPFSGVQVFVDNQDAGESKVWGKSIDISTSPDTHSVIVWKDGYWPWTKNVTLTENETYVLHPFLLLKNPKKEIVNADDKRITALFQNNTLKEPARFLLEKKNIGGARSTDLYPKRNDVIIVAAQNSVFAIDTDDGEPVNFQPIYDGVSPYFSIGDKEEIYIKDGDQIYRLEII